MRRFHKWLKWIFDVLNRRDPGVRFPPSRVCLLRTHAIGDVLLTTPAIRAVKKAWPGAHITMLVGERCRPALEANPYIDSIQSFPEDWWFNHRFGKLLELTWRLRRRQPEVLIILHSSLLIHLWGYLMGAPVRVGFDENGSGAPLTHRVIRTQEDYDRYLGDINLDLVRALGISPDRPQLGLFLEESEREAVSRLLPNDSDPAGPLLIGVAPGGGQNALEKISVKHWPAEHYVSLLFKLAQSTGASFLLLGDSKDTQADLIADEARKLGVRVANSRGKTSFRELAALIQRVDLLITNDSSPLHIAIALGRPVVALFGPTANWALCPSSPSCIALQSPAECSPCYKFGRFKGCPDPTCMAALTVEEVKEAVELVLNRGFPDHFKIRLAQCFSQS